MRTPQGVSKDEWQEWRTSHVTKAVLAEVATERDFIAGAMARGEILNLDNPVITHGNAARCWGQLETLEAFIEFLGQKDESV